MVNKAYAGGSYESKYKSVYARDNKSVYKKFDNSSSTFTKSDSKSVYGRKGNSSYSKSSKRVFG